MILSLDWVDLGGTLKVARRPAERARSSRSSLDHHLHNGWSMDHQGLPPVDLFIAADPDATVAGCSMRSALPPEPAKPRAAVVPAPKKARRSGDDGSRSRIWRCNAARRGRRPRASPSPICRCPGTAPGGRSAIRSTISAPTAAAGSAAGPGISVGAALALKGSGRLPVAICGDGDFLMGVTALWTAAHYRIPLLFVIANNRSFYNDEVHQERVARMRNRPVENNGSASASAIPTSTSPRMARAQGARGFGPVTKIADLAATFAEAIAAVEAGDVAVVDVRVEPGYAPTWPQR